MVKATYKSDLHWSAIFNVIVYCKYTSDGMQELKASTAMAGVKLLNIVGSKSLFSPNTNLFLFNEGENNIMLNTLDNLTAAYGLEELKLLAVSVTLSHKGS